MEIKWIMIAVMVIMLGAFTGMALEQHERNQCSIEALKALVKPELIHGICK